VLRAAEAVTELTDPRLRQRLASLIEGAAPAEIRANILRLLEERGMRSLEIIREEGRNEGRAEGRRAARGSRNEGRAEGRCAVRSAAKARTLLKLLRLRGFAVDDATAERVLATTDVSVLDRWVERSLSARSLEEVLEG
jgi:predicted transposase YdaD